MNKDKKQWLEFYKAEKNHENNLDSDFPYYKMMSPKVFLWKIKLFESKKNI